MKKQLFLSALGMIATVLTASAQHKAFGYQDIQWIHNDCERAYIDCARDTLKMGFEPSKAYVGILAGKGYTVTTDDAWLSAEKHVHGLVISASYSYLVDKRVGSFTLTTADGSYSRKLYVEQAANTSASAIEGDKRLAIGSANADQSQSGEPISNTYDNNFSTIWHSPYGSTTTTFPITLTYTLKEAGHVDYMLYTPRQDGNTNGNFKQITVSYATSAAPDKWVKLCDKNLDGASSAAKIAFGNAGIDDVLKVQIVVKSGQGNYASCSEMGFYQNDGTFGTLVKQYFKDELCTQLADGVTLESAATIPDPYLRQLVSYMASGEYSTKYRVGEFEPYETINTVRDRLKTSNPPCNYENPTGIYFEKGQTLAIFVEGATTVKPTLKIYCFGEGNDFQTSSTYSLQNGINVITTRTRGNGYLMYYSDDYAKLPNVRVHFAMATENGYFDLQRGDTNEDWINLLAGATSDIIDIRSPRMQAAMPLKTLRSVCPKKGVELATIYDNIIYREREVMGLVQGIPGFTAEPKNRQFARPASSGMFASTEGAYAAFGSLGGWCNPDDFGFWGIGHELGHNNQITNGFKWPGLGETTNNIYASWVEHKLGTGYHRLEDEVSGIDAYKGMRGGRFEAYLEEGVRKGVSWQLQDGPDYHGAEPTADGSRNYDHFVKVVPLYQLNLWTQDCGKSPNAYGKVIQGYRTLTNNPGDSGKQQINFMRNFCDSTQIDFLDFFERAGMLRPIDRMIEDYSKGRLTITQKMIDDLRAYINAKGYPKAPAALNYLNAYNLSYFRDETPITAGTLNAGCSKSGEWVTVTHAKWPGAVGFETYDADGNCTAISMYGLGDTQQKATKTKVLYPAGSKYIMAVGFDGTRVKCYEK